MRLFILALALFPATASAEESSHDVTVAPIGAVFGAYAAEYEQTLLERVSAFVEVAWLDDIQPPETMQRYTGAGLRLGARWFPLQRALRGAFVGLELHGTLGTVTTSSGEYRGKAIGVAPQVGYSFVLWNHLDLSLGLGVELNTS